MSNFLKDRKQRVVIGGEHSTWTHVISGVPQRRVLGPLFFLTYINDLPKDIHSSIRLFADGCVLHREIKNVNDSQELQKDLNSLMKWEYDWQMHFNPQQCFAMRLTHARHLTRFNYILGDKSLQKTDNHPYLGAHITKYLRWNKHIHQVTATPNRTIAFVRRNLYSCPQHIKNSAYTTLVRPLLEYSSSVCDTHTNTLVNKIEMVQRRVARFCHNDYKTIEKGCMCEMIDKLYLEPLNITTRRTHIRLTIFHKAINGLLALLIAHLQPVLRRTRHLNSKAYNTIHTSKGFFLPQDNKRLEFTTR